jgi:hypothetical protein
LSLGQHAPEITIPTSRTTTVPHYRTQSCLECDGRTLQTVQRVDPTKMGWLATCTAALQIQAALILFVGVVGWTASGLARRRELRRQLSGRLTAAAEKRRCTPGTQVCIPSQRALPRAVQLPSLCKYAECACITAARLSVTTLLLEQTNGDGQKCPHPRCRHRRCVWSCPCEAASPTAAPTGRAS